MQQLVEKNQRFGTLDLAVMVALIAVIGGISQAIVREVCTDHRRLEARMKAESLAFRLAATDELKAPSNASSKDLSVSQKISQKTSDVVQSRGLASVETGLPTLEGQIGEDPWGHPYRYTMKKDALGKISEVSVWSSGPVTTDKKAEEVSNANPIRYVYTAPLQSRNRLVPPVSN